MFQILIAEDEDTLRELMSDYLMENGYQVHRAKNGSEALQIIDCQHIDLLISDVMMPVMDGYTLTSQLRQAGYTLPIMLVTVKETLDDKRQGFLAGTDDYMVKPVDFEEMLLRTSALLHRMQISNGKKLTIGEYVLDYNSLTVSSTSETQVLPKKEFQLLFKLMSAPNKTFTRAQLMDDIWGLDSMTDERTVDVHIKRLRNRFCDVGAFRIATIHGLGYKAEIKE